ncbi:MAG: hypothetical protein A2X86_02870 [Bdellovibrionales bacterium GWA2_49_15]|nr:MAG: hypothetical protein A2X86_02870 [Bdellovibrionales bacterium GWA2_49_15]HAZ14118.1 hypothetical protein [Bdellovibrionales bacterium]
MEIALQHARHIILQAQKLTAPMNPSTLQVIRDLGHIQIDTISVVQRAHHHTLWSRNPDYKLSELGELQTQRKIFEYWSHAASYLPMESYRFCLPRMHLYQTGKNHWFVADKKIKKYVLDKITAEGPKKASDFKSPRKKTGWFDWAPSKKALELLFMEGTLMATRREGFHKVYDLRERVLPAELNTSFPTEKEYAEFLISEQLKNQGLALSDEIAYQRGARVKALVRQTLEEMVEDKRLISVKIKNQKGPYYIRPQVLETGLKPSGMAIHILSPFDNLVIQRKRLEFFFDFNYQVECYVPAPKRKFGYFCLPILAGDKFIGRMDAKADRKNGIFQVKKIFFETPKLQKKISRPLQKKIEEFAQFNECPKLEFF